MTHLGLDRPEPAEVVALIRTCQDGLAPSLAEPGAAEAYAEKLVQHSAFVTRREQGQLVGAVAFYANDLESRRAFITLVAVQPALRGRRIATDMVAETRRRLAEAEFRSAHLKVMKGNDPAIALYRGFGFEIVGEDDTQFEMAVNI